MHKTNRILQSKWFYLSSIPIIYTYTYRHISWLMVKYRHISPHVHIIPRPLCNNALQAAKGLLTLHNDAHQASAGPLRPVNYQKRWPLGPCKMNIVFIFVWSFEHGVHFCMGRVVIVFIIHGWQWARRSLVCIIVPVSYTHLTLPTILRV